MAVVDSLPENVLLGWARLEDKLGEANARLFYLVSRCNCARTPATTRTHTPPPPPPHTGDESILRFQMLEMPHEHHASRVPD